MPKNKLSAWLQAFRLRTLPLALASIGMGSFLAAFEAQFNAGVFSLTIFTALLLQILSNLANDYGDFKNGADLSGRTGPARAVQSGIISEKEMRWGIIVFVLLALICGVTLLWFAFYQTVSLRFLFFLFVGIAAIAAAVKYTAGKNPYGYIGMGDLFVFIFFGVVGVAGSYYLQTMHLPCNILLPAFSVGFLATAVLNINNIRDIDADKKAGKYTIPVRIGFKAAKIYHVCILTAAMLCITLYIILNTSACWQSTVFLSFPLLIYNGIRIILCNKNAFIDPLLKQMALSSLFFVLSFGIGGLVA